MSRYAGARLALRALRQKCTHPERSAVSGRSPGITGPPYHLRRLFHDRYGGLVAAFKGCRTPAPGIINLRRPPRFLR